MRRAVTPLLGLGAVALVALTLATGAAASGINECGNWGVHANGRVGWGMGPIQGAGIFNVTTRRVGCRTARRFVRRYKGTDSGYPRWRCHEINDYESSDVRCTAAGGRVIRWQSGS